MCETEILNEGLSKASLTREGKGLKSWCMSHLARPFFVPYHMNCVFPVLSERRFDDVQAWIESIACRTLVANSTEVHGHQRL